MSLPRTFPTMFPRASFVCDGARRGKALEAKAVMATQDQQTRTNRSLIKAREVYSLQRGRSIPTDIRQLYRELPVEGLTVTGRRAGHDGLFRVGTSTLLRTGGLREPPVVDRSPHEIQLGGADIDRLSGREVVPSSYIRFPDQAPSKRIDSARPKIPQATTGSSFGVTIRDRRLVMPIR